MSITTRPQFVSLRNAFFGALNEKYRQTRHVNRVSTLSAGGKNAANRQNEADRHVAEIEDMSRDYDVLREISAMDAPKQNDFDRAEAIGDKWHVYA